MDKSAHNPDNAERVAEAIWCSIDATDTPWAKVDERSKAVYINAAHVAIETMGNSLDALLRSNFGALDEAMNENGDIKVFQELLDSYMKSGKITAITQHHCRGGAIAVALDSDTVTIRMIDGHDRDIWMDMTLDFEDFVKLAEGIGEAKSLAMKAVAAGIGRNDITQRASEFAEWMQKLTEQRKEGPKEEKKYNA